MSSTTEELQASGEESGEESEESDSAESEGPGGLVCPRKGQISAAYREACLKTLSHYPDWASTREIRNDVVMENIIRATNGTPKTLGGKDNVEARGQWCAIDSTPCVTIEFTYAWH